MTNQELFTQEYSKLNQTNTDQNEYGMLVYSLEAVFKNAGYAISGKELAGSFHSQIVGMIGQSDFNKICRGFIANFTMITSTWPPYALKDVVEGNLNYNYELSRTPTIGAFLLSNWQKQVAVSLKKGADGKRIMRRGKRYETWLNEKSEKACPAMLEATHEVMAERTKKIVEFLEDAEKDDISAREMIAHYERTVYVINAFIAVSNAEDKWEIVQGFEEKIGLLRKGLEKRDRSREYLVTKEHTSEEILDASLQDDGALKDLLNYYLGRKDDNTKR